jgi:hypothetical protein
MRQDAEATSVVYHAAMNARHDASIRRKESPAITVEVSHEAESDQSAGSSLPASPVVVRSTGESVYRPSALSHEQTMFSEASASAHRYDHCIIPYFY